MPEDVFRWMITGAVLIAALCIIVQAVVVVLLYSTFKKVQVRANALMDRAEPILTTVKEVIAENRPKVVAISNDAVEIARIAREQVARLSDFVRDFTERAKAQVARIDGAVDETVEQVQNAGGAVRSAIVKPVREIEGLWTGLKTGLATFTRKRRASVDHATQDEEMFI